MNANREVIYTEGACGPHQLLPHGCQHYGLLWELEATVVHWAEERSYGDNDYVLNMSWIDRRQENGCTGYLHELLNVVNAASAIRRAIIAFDAKREVLRKGEG